MGLVKRVALGMGLLTLLVWIVYTVVFVEGVGFHQYMGEWMLVSGATATIMGFIYFLLDGYEDERRRITILAFCQQAHMWVAVSLYVFVGGYFATEHFTVITVISIILLYATLMVSDAPYFFDGWTKAVRQRLSGYTILLAEVYAFYSAYYFDGPYCRTIGYGIAAGLTVVFSIVVIAAWLIEEEEKDERRR